MDLPVWDWNSKEAHDVLQVGLVPVACDGGWDTLATYIGGFALSFGQSDGRMEVGSR